MYIREHKGKWRFAECYPDPLTGKKREVSVVMDKNTPQTRKEASALLQEKNVTNKVREADNKRLDAVSIL